MKNENNKLIILSLGMLVIFAFGIFIPLNKAAAYAYGTHINYQTNDGGYNGEAPVQNPKPKVGSINPTSSNVGVGTKTITITGNGFIPSSVARVNGSNRLTTFIDDSHLLIQITGNDTYAYRANGGFFITVFNGAPGGGYSNSAFFTVNTVVTPVSNTNNTSPDNFTDTPQTSNTSGNTTNNTNTNGNTDNYNSLASNAIFGSNTFFPSGLVQWVLFAIIVLLIVIIVRKIFGAKEEYDESPMKHA